MDPIIKLLVLTLAAVLQAFFPADQVLWGLLVRQDHAGEAIAPRPAPNATFGPAYGLIRYPKNLH